MVWNWTYTISTNSAWGFLKRASQSIRTRLPETRDDWFNFIGWWLLGVTSDFGYWIVVTASHDLLSVHEEEYITPKGNITSLHRQCNIQSSGFLLIPVMLPCILSTLVFPFLPLFIHLRVFGIVTLSACSFVLLGPNVSWGLTITGIVFVSLAYGTSMSTYLRYVANFKSSTLISVWSSGNGASGLLAGLFYVLATEAGVRISTIVYCLLIIPAIMAFAFWYLLNTPKEDGCKSKFFVKEVKMEPDKEMKMTIDQKLYVLYAITFKYVIPFTLVFVIQYFIVLGLLELVYFDGRVIDLSSRFRILMFVFMFSAFIGKSSGNLFELKNLWLLVLFQVINLILMVTEAIYSWLGEGILGFCIVIFIMIWEGVTAGANYVHTLKNVSKSRSDVDKDFSLSITMMGETLGIFSAGLMSLPVHAAICNLPNP